MIVYVVIISDTDNEFFEIHSVHATEEGATQEVKELESRLDEDMIVSYEPHEVTE